MVVSSRLRAITTADVFPHTAGLSIVPFVTKARKRQPEDSGDVQIVINMAMQSSVMLRQIVTLSVTLLSAQYGFGYSPVSIATDCRQVFRADCAGRTVPQNAANASDW